MKKFIFSLIVVAATVVSAYAQLNGSGFYRVHNYDTGRYIYVYDNTGSVDLTGTTVDLYAIQLWKGLDRAISDPGSVLYIEDHGGKYDIKAQGTSIYNLIGVYASMRADNKVPGTYWAYGTSHGLTKYLCDGSSNPDKEQSWLVGEGTSRRNWYVTPIDASTDNYFGVTPTVNADGAYWAPLYADFSFTFASKGMEAYYVKTIDADRGLAVLDKAPANVGNAVPVIIRCAGADKSANRLNLTQGTGDVPAGNLLKGVYFNYSDVAKHINRVAYNKNTMRVLGKTQDGHLGLVTANIDYIPRNSFYLTVPAGSAAELRLVSQAEYDQLTNADIPATSISLDVTTLALDLGQSRQIKATVQPSNATDRTVVWTSSADAVASVDANGRVTAVSEGVAEITAACGNLRAVCKVTVTDPNPKIIKAESIILNTNSVELKINEEFALTATVKPDNTTDKTVSWSSSNPAVARISDDGTIVALKAGESVIKAQCGDAMAFCDVVVKDIEVEEITLSETEITLKPGTTAYIYYYLKPADAKNQYVTWTSSDPEVATVSDMGTVKALAPGVTVITASVGKVSATCTVTVQHIEPSSLTVAPRKAEVKAGETLQLTATVSPSATTRPVEWSTSDATVLTVDANGLVTAVAEGEADACVACGEFTATCHVKVNASDGICDITTDLEGTFDVYNLEGQKVRGAVSSLEHLPSGVYIVNGQKYLVK